MSVLVVAAVIVAMQEPPTAPTRDPCIDEFQRNRCGPPPPSQNLAAHALQPIEDEAKAGSEIYRVLYVDGYGRTMPTVSVERRPGRAPEVIVHISASEALKAPVAAETWREVQAKARLADRQLEPLSPGGPLDGMCMHAWQYTVEMANPWPYSYAGAIARRRHESACEGGLAQEFAWAIAAAAVASIPECDVLDPKEYRNDVSRLAVCAGFSGDRLAAAELVNQIGFGEVRLDRDADRVWAWRRWLGGWDTKLTWSDGVVVQNQGSRGLHPVETFLATQQSEHPTLRFHMSQFHGTSAEEVRVTGVAWRREGAAEREARAPFIQTWTWSRPSQVWQLTSWIVEPFRPVQ